MAKKKSSAIEVEVVPVTEVPVLAVKNNLKPVNVLVNFDEVGSYLDLLIKRYDTVEFTVDNIDEVNQVDAVARGLWSKVEAFEKEIKTEYFNDPKKLFETGIAPIKNKIIALRNRAGEVKAEIEAARVAEVNEILDIYIADAMAEYQLEDEYEALFEKKKGFYNKTAKEAEIIADISAQAAEFAKQRKAYNAGSSLIKKACEKDRKLNVEMYLDQLRSGKDVATILEDIENEIARLAEVEKMPISSFSATSAIDVDTSLDDEDFKTDLPERTKVKRIELTYPAEAGAALTKLFRELAQRGVKVKDIT